MYLEGMIEMNKELRSVPTRNYIILGIILIIFWFAILVPVLSFQYSKRILKNVKRVWLYVLWHALVIALSYLVFVITEGESYLFALIIS